ncbi:MAG: DUF4407 domain-containing protein [Bacteroides sp.]|nr:DUF4407 domain-containing protein [Bacteroides sp.]
MSSLQSNNKPTSIAGAESQNSIHEHKRCGWINEFLWTCAGVNKQVLRQCPSDYAKYSGIGGTILFTAMMAALSGGYALNFVFHNVYISCAFGVFWGLLIFNLDRFIVNTMYSDGKHTISWDEIKSGLPRIIMAIFLGIVISTPLELKIFEDKIKMQIEEEKSEILEHRLEGLTADKQKIEEEIISIQQGAGDLYGDHIHTGNQQIDALSDSIDQTQPILNSVQSQLAALLVQKNRLDRTTDSYAVQKAAIEAKAKPLYARRSYLSSKLKKWRAERSALQGKVSDIAITQTNDKRDQILKLTQEEDSISKLIASARTLHVGWSKDNIRNKGSERDKINLEYGGFNAQLKAFHDIRKEDPSTDVAAWFVMLLFIIVETAPTFFKMMMEDGPYDDLIRAEKHRVNVLAQKRISDVNDEVNTSVKISTMKNQKRLEAEILANEDILKRLAEVQAELLQKSIDAWREEELRKIEENPIAYIKITTNHESEQA